MRVLIFHAIINSDSFPRQGKKIPSPKILFKCGITLMLKLSPENWQHRVAKPQSLYSMEVKQSLLKFINVET